MRSGELVVAVQRECDLVALKAMLDIVRDPSRLPKVEASTTMEHISKAELSWTHTDSPKREACLSITMKNAGGVRTGGRERARDIASLILETAFSSDLEHFDLDRCEKDLKELARHAALLDTTSPDHPPSLQDHCSAMAGTPWRPALATRHKAERKAWDIVTMDEHAIARHLPEMPMIVLVRNAGYGRCGVLNVGVTPFRGSTDFQSLDPVARLRAMERFS